MWLAMTKLALFDAHSGSIEYTRLYLKYYPKNAKTALKQTGRFIVEVPNE